MNSPTYVNDLVRAFGLRHNTLQAYRLYERLLNGASDEEVRAFHIRAKIA